MGNFCLKTALSWWDWTRLPQNGVTKAAVCNQAIIVGGQLLLPCLSTRTRSRGNTKLDFASGLLCRLSTFSKVIALAIGNYPFERIVRSRWWAGYSRCTCSCIKDPFSSLSLAAKRYPRDTGKIGEIQRQFGFFLFIMGLDSSRVLRGGKCAGSS